MCRYGEGQTILATSANELDWTTMKMCAEGATYYKPTVVPMDWTKADSELATSIATLQVRIGSSNYQQTAELIHL